MLLAVCYPQSSVYLPDRTLPLCSIVVFRSMIALEQHCLNGDNGCCFACVGVSHAHMVFNMLELQSLVCKCVLWRYLCHYMFYFKKDSSLVNMGSRGRDLPSEWA